MTPARDAASGKPDEKHEDAVSKSLESAPVEVGSENSDSELEDGQGKIETSTLLSVLTL